MSEGLKKGWRVWRFDQMATMVNDRIDDPAEANVEYYVGLEHLDPESLTIRRWGSPSDVNATKLLFRKGDIIFGRRRVYQRKLAIAHFDGICSAHALVLRAKPEVVLPEFLPYFMQSDLFMERAKQISVGSLSPTINWKTLAKEEFALPPMEEQYRLINFLKAKQGLAGGLRIALDKLDRVSLSSQELYFNKKKNKYRKIGDLSIVKGGKRLPKGMNYTMMPSQHPYIRVVDIDGGFISDNTVKYISEKTHKLISNYIVSKDDVILSIAGTIGRVALVTGKYDGANLTENAVKITTDKDHLLPEYLFRFLTSKAAQSQINAFTMKTTQPKLALFRVREIEIPIITIAEQMEINKFMKKLDEYKKYLSLRIKMAENIFLPYAE